MSVASLITLLTTALALLMLVQSNPALPQAVGDQVIAIANKAIVEASAQLGIHSQATQTIQTCPAGETGMYPNCATVAAPTTAPAYAMAYTAQRQELANAIVSQDYNPSYGLLDNAQVGGCGNQPHAFSIIDENFFAGYALAPYNSQVADTIAKNVARYLGLAGYGGNDRREVLFHKQVALPIFGTIQATIEGSPPHCPSPTGFWITTELPNTAAPLNRYTESVNEFVPVILDEYLSGDTAKAQADFNTLTALWQGIGFSTSRSTTTYFTRDLAYYLFAQRATGFSSSIAPAVEKQLWSLQRADGTLWTTYDHSGSGFGHTSGEINSLALLAYEVYQWWLPSNSPAATQDSAATASSIPIEQRVLPDGTIRYFVPVTIGATTIDAMLDTGSAGLRVLSSALPTGAYTLIGSPITIRYGGPVLTGYEAVATVALGATTVQTPIEVVTSISCDQSDPSCDTADIFGFKAILGIDLRGSQIPNPLTLTSSKTWLLSLPLPGSTTTGTLTLNPPASQTLGYARIALPKQTASNTGPGVAPLWASNEIPVCITREPAGTTLCGGASFDTGAFNIHAIPHDNSASWPYGTPVQLSISVASGMLLTDSFSSGSSPGTQVYLTTSAQSARTLNVGPLPFYAFDALYDANNGVIGLKHRSFAN